MGKRAELRLKRQQEKRNRSILIFSIAGVILLFFAWMILSGNKTTSDTPADGSVVPVEVNYPAPNLTLGNINGQVESLADYRDKVVLVNNWATWCPPCKAEMPTLVDFYNTHASENLMVIAIEAGEPAEQVQQFVDTYQMTFAVWLDPNGLSAQAFQNNTLPNSYVIDRNGTVRFTWTGQINQEMLEKYVAPLLHEN
jgi:peroxiredoxin